MSAIYDEVLVMNRGWVPIRLTSAQEAIISVVKGAAKIIDTADEGLGMYDWDGWIELPLHANYASISTVKYTVRVPKVIVTNKYAELPPRDIQLNKANLCERDDFTCQYCLKPVTMKSATIDHVIPKSRGGENSWENFAISCAACNSKKSNKTPKEAGLKLYKVPRKPKFRQLPFAGSRKLSADVKRFLLDQN